MAQVKTALRLRVNQGGKVSQRYLMANERFSIGRSSDNDVVLFGENYPRKHVLVFNNNNRTMLRIPKFANGEVWVNNSKLAIQDLTKHRLLPVHGDAFILPIFDGKEGYLNLSDSTRVEFAFTQVSVTGQSHLKPFDGFHWHKVFVKELTKDLYFKLIFLFFFLLNAIILYAYKDIKIVRKQEDIQVQTERLVKISMKIIPEKELEANINELTTTQTTTDASEEETKSEEPKPTRKRRKRKPGQKKRGNKNSAGGLLGLISGSGSSSQKSSVLDLLVDKGLTADLNRAMGSGSNLKRGSGGASSSTEDVLSGLIGTGGGIGGIDDLIDDYVDEEVEVVKLKKKPKVKIQKATESSISQDAQGFRTMQSIQKVVGRIQGRLQYTYEKFLKRDVNFRGKVTIEFTISAAGRVVRARIRESTTGKAEFDQAVLRAIKRLKFPKIPKGEAKFVFPFVFQRIE